MMYIRAQKHTLYISKFYLFIIPIKPEPGNIYKSLMFSYQNIMSMDDIILF